MKTETKLIEPEKASIYGKFARIKEESTKPIGYHLIGDMVSDAQDAKTKRVIAEWLEARGFELFVEALFETEAFVLSLEEYKEFKKWALGE